MTESLQTVGDLLSNTKKIAYNLGIVGSNSLSIRDAAVAELGMICPENPDIAETVGIDITGITNQARSDLTDLATFINEGLAVLDKNLESRNQRMLPKLALDGSATRDSCEQLIHCLQSGD